MVIDLEVFRQITSKNKEGKRKNAKEMLALFIEKVFLDEERSVSDRVFDVLCCHAAFMLFVGNHKVGKSVRKAIVNNVENPERVIGGTVGGTVGSFVAGLPGKVVGAVVGALVSDVVKDMLKDYRT